MINERLFLRLAAEPFGPSVAIADLEKEPNSPLSADLRDTLASLSPEQIDAARGEPHFDVRRRHRDGEDAALRRWALEFWLMKEVPARRLRWLLSGADIEAISGFGVILDSEGLADASSMQFDGSLFSTDSRAFLPFPSTASPNSCHWLMQHLARAAPRFAVRLDPFLNGPSGEYPAPFYKMLVYGRELNWDKIKALKEPDHGQWQPDDREFEVARTDYVWDPRGDEVHFVCEELPTEPALTRRGARYLHAVYSRTSDQFIHLDGAIRVYDNALLKERMDTHVRRAGKAGTRAKLFRLDAPLARDAFANIAASFFVWNDDVGRYFAGAG